MDILNISSYGGETDVLLQVRNDKRITEKPPELLPPENKKGGSETVVPKRNKSSSKHKSVHNIARSIPDASPKKDAKNSPERSQPVTIRATDQCYRMQ
jgi:hypothetical protein